MIIISLNQQKLFLIEQSQLLREYSVSTGKNGAGEINGSEQTPRGWHQIRAKIGTDSKANTVFVGRRPTGEIYTPSLGEQFPGRDWILTRILWLSGLEPGKNRFGTVDTMQRYIYIHGSPDSVDMGHPGSRGCIRMRNSDLTELFEHIKPGIRVNITED